MGVVVSWLLILVYEYATIRLQALQARNIFNTICTTIVEYYVIFQTGFILGGINVWKTVKIMYNILFIFIPILGNFTVGYSEVTKNWKFEYTG